MILNGLNGEKHMELVFTKLANDLYSQLSVLSWEQVEQLIGSINNRNLKNTRMVIRLYFTSYITI